MVQPSNPKRLHYDRLIKVLIIGDSGAGKSSLMFRVTDNTFTPSFITTIGVDYKDKMYDIDGKRIKTQLWDTAGQEKFRTITTAYFRGAHCVVFVYDVTDDRSFNNIRRWLKVLKENATQNVNMLLLANKIDLVERRLIDTEKGRELAEESGMEYAETSARTGQNVHDAFYGLIKTAKERLEQETLTSVRNQGYANNGQVIIDEPATSNQSKPGKDGKTGCCT